MSRQLAGLVPPSHGLRLGFQKLRFAPKGGLKPKDFATKHEDEMGSIFPWSEIDSQGMWRVFSDVME
jgi:hypothetical protein